MKQPVCTFILSPTSLAAIFTRTCHRKANRENRNERYRTIRRYFRRFQKKQRSDRYVYLRYGHTFYDLMPRATNIVDVVEKKSTGREREKKKRRRAAGRICLKHEMDNSSLWDSLASICLIAPRWTLWKINSAFEWRDSKWICRIHIPLWIIFARELYYRKLCYILICWYVIKLCWYVILLYCAWL